MFRIGTTYAAALARTGVVTSAALSPRASAVRSAAAAHDEV